jgi:RES domain-containing protein
MRIWRLQRSVYPVLNGEGARLYGGRWNFPGRPVVYTSESLALCALELLIHVDSDLIPSDLMAYEIDLPDDLIIESIEEERLPTSWRHVVSCPACQSYGEAWLERAQAAVLAVPSAVLTHGRNILINPLHLDAARIRLVRQEPFTMDQRLLK